MAHEERGRSPSWRHCLVVRRAQLQTLTLTTVKATGLTDLLAVLAEEGIVNLDWGLVVA